MIDRRPSLAILLLAAACGGPEPAPAPEPTAPEPSPGGETEAEVSPWDELTTERLVALVRERSRGRIAEVAPDLDLSQLDSWVADPDGAPALGDRVSEQLIHLAIAAAAAGENERAVGLVRLVRAKARNRNNAYTGTTLLSELARRGAEDAEAQRVAIRDVFDELPRNRFGSATVVFQIFQNPGQVEARLEQLHGQLVSLDTAVSALFYEAILTPIVEHRDLFLGVIEQVREAHAAEEDPEEHAFSTVDLSDARNLEPIVVAVWDTGVAGALFEEQLFVNEDETVNGEDDDDNGLVDDRHGVIADPTEGQTGLTFEPGPAVVDEYAPFLQGIMDLRAGLASTPAAQRVLQLLGSAQDAEALDRLEQNLNAIGEWAHGTHVAGIMLAGLPQARVAVFRSAWAGEARLYHHRGPTDEELAAERENVENIARFIEAHDVRVVNASLGFARDYVENELRHQSDVYETDEEVRARAEAIHQHRTEIWRMVFERCPDTLFVVAAGNSNRDVVEYGDVPASLSELPNLLVVGAVDRYGDWATFTNSNPDRVTVFDWGVEVPSVIPNGETVPLSGTSMASPNVANLAAKMIAVNPALEPSEVISIIRETGEPIAEPFYGRIAHEERAVARARRMRRRAR
ncbi:MAG TPA: S8 family serine peptidase [Sandaracinaceae bacterium LLY-WYZ-13_1]|nr:S8 family serine peptidase [Sandaracinaceae bacterium LLY-WYZ-13_1]